MNNKMLKSKLSEYIFTTSEAFKILEEFPNVEIESEDSYFIDIKGTQLHFEGNHLFHRRKWRIIDCEKLLKEILFK